MGEGPLSTRHCRARTTRLDSDAATAMLADIHSDWSIGDNGDRIQRTFQFRDFYQTMAFVNALAWVAHREDHHPDLEVGYKTCTVFYSTHSVGGLSENDFICAARIDALHDTDV